MENVSKGPWREEHDNITRELKSSKDVWLYSDKLRWYLLAIGRNPDATESINNFPRRIVLPEAWTNLFKEMITSTKKDGLERYSVIATDNTSGRVLLPNEYATGESTRVNGFTIARHHKDAQKLGADNIVGSIHTHPTKFSYRSLRRKLHFLFTGCFSAADLYKPVIMTDELIKGVIDLNKEITFVFRTQETGIASKLNYLPKKYQNQISFEDYWYRTKHIIFDDKTRIGEMMDGYEADVDHFEDLLWEVNTDIAKKHNLAIYRGKVLGSNSYLTRFYPSTSDSINEDDVKKK